jgi:flagellar biosynthesis anti-sigma factor FlgM
MDLRIQNLGQHDVDPTANLKSGSSQPLSSSSQSANSTRYSPDAPDTASISSATSQLSSTDLPIRQDRVDALRMQIESGTYTVNPRAVATAMFQNLFRS